MCLFSSVDLLFQIIPNEIPISKYSIVQTGPNKYAGGFHVGLISVSNHWLLLALASKPLIIPTLSHKRMVMMNFQVDDNLVVLSIFSNHQLFFELNEGNISVKQWCIFYVIFSLKLNQSLVAGLCVQIL